MSSAREIKAFLREQGIETSSIRISVDSSINVKILDPKLPFDQIEQLLKDKYESYQRDEATGEILSGGNTFVFIDYDYDVIRQVSEELRGSIMPFLRKCSGQWDLRSLVKHYVETEPLEYDVRVTKRAIYDALHAFLSEDPNAVPGLSVGLW